MSSETLIGGKYVPSSLPHLKESNKSSELVTDIDIFVYIYFGRTLAVHFKVQLWLSTLKFNLTLCLWGWWIVFPPPFHHLKKSIKSSEPVRDIDSFVYIYFGRTLAVHFKVQLDFLSLHYAF